MATAFPDSETESELTPADSDEMPAVNSEPAQTTRCVNLESSKATVSSNVYSSLLTGSQQASSSRSRTETSKDEQGKKRVNKSSLAVVSHNSRGLRSSVRPFFCCGSELSLVSLVDGLELHDGHGRSPAPLNSIECAESSSEEEDSLQESSTASKSPVAGVSGNRGVMRRKKKDKHSVKKKFWSLRLRGKWNTRWRVSQGQRSSSHSPSSMSQGSYQATNSPGSSCRSLRQRAGSSNNGPQWKLYPTEDVHTRRQMERVLEVEVAQGVEINRIIFHRALLSNLGLSNSMLDLLHHLRRIESFTTLDTPDLPSEEDYSVLMNNLMVQQQLPGSPQSHREGPTEEVTNKAGASRIYTQVDYIHCLVPELVRIMSCPFYWGIMDRYEAERLLDNKPEGTFLLRDSAQEDFLFSVSFRRYNRCLHARVEQWNHRFSFDAHDPCVYSAPSVCELMEHYKDPSSCMFFEPMLTRPLARNFSFSLQHICRAVICDTLVYDHIHHLPIPNSLKQFLQVYHYKQKVRVRHFDGSGVVYAVNTLSF